MLTPGRVCAVSGTWVSKHEHLAMSGSTAPGVPSSAPPAIDTQQQDGPTPEQAQQLFAPLQTSVEPAPLSPSYIVGLYVTAWAMLLLPALYMTLVALAVWYTPFFLGWLFLPFALKPFFAPVPQRARYSLNPQYQPALFEFVRLLCEALGAPLPNHIEVDVQVNASMGFRNGLWGLLNGDRCLTIGLPLVTGLTAQQFAGVLAHELGHAAQGVATRLVFIVGSVNNWFRRVVYERDAWDMALWEWSEDEEAPALQILSFVLRIALGATRGVLYVFMIAGHAVSCFLLRQMEFDADGYEARFAGAEAFMATSQRMHCLSVAFADAHDDLFESWRQGRLADNLPALLMVRLEQLQADPERSAKIKEQIEERRTDLFDDHPSTRDRIAAVLANPAPGVYHVPLPASLLFFKFDAVCVEATFHYYRQQLGRRINRQKLISTDRLVSERKAIEQADDAAQRYFHGNLLNVRQIFPPHDALLPPENAKQTLKALKAARSRMLAAAPRVSAALERYETADKSYHQAMVARSLGLARLQFDPKVFNVPATTQGPINHARQRALTERHEAVEDLREFVDQASTRLFCALQLLYVPDVRKRLGATALEQAKRLVPVLDELRCIWDKALELDSRRARLYLLAEALVNPDEQRDLTKELWDQLQGATNEMMEIRRRLASSAYPYEHAQSQISVADYALPHSPTTGDIGQVLDGSQMMTDNLRALYFRAMGQLVATAVQVERAFGAPE